MVTKKYKIAGKHVEHNDSTSQALFLGGGRTEKSDGKHDKFWAKTTFEFLHRYGKVTIEEIHKWPCDKRADMPTSLSKCTKMFCCCCWCCSNSFGLYPNTTKWISNGFEHIRLNFEGFELIWSHKKTLSDQAWKSLIWAFLLAYIKTIGKLVFYETIVDRWFCPYCYKKCQK